MLQNIFKISYILMLLIIMSHDSHAVGINDGLVGWWKLDEGSGTSAVDSSGNGNTGTLTNGPTWVSGKRGNAVSFDGNNDYIACSDTNFIAGSAARTISVWVWLNSYVDFQTILNYGSSIQYQGFNLSISSSAQGRKIAVYTYNNAPSAYGNTTIPLNQWVHLAVTFSGTNLAYYFNGVADGVATVNNVNTVLNSCAIGKSINNWDAPGGTYFWPGYFDDIRVYNRILSTTEIAMLAQNRNQIRNAGLINGQVK